MQVLGKRKIHQERQHATQRTPISKDAPGLGIAGGEGMREQSRERLKAGWSLRCKPGACAQRATAYVEKNEGRDNERVHADAPLLHVRVQHGLRVKGEVTPAG